MSDETPEKEPARGGLELNLAEDVQRLTGPLPLLARRLRRLPPRASQISLWLIGLLALAYLLFRATTFARVIRSAITGLWKGDNLNIVCITAVILAMASLLAWALWLYLQAWRQGNEHRFIVESRNSERRHELLLVELLCKQWDEAVSGLAPEVQAHLLPHLSDLLGNALTRARRVDSGGHLLQTSTKPNVVGSCALDGENLMSFDHARKEDAAGQRVTLKGSETPPK